MIFPQTILCSLSPISLATSPLVSSECLVTSLLPCFVSAWLPPQLVLTFWCIYIAGRSLLYLRHYLLLIYFIIHIFPLLSEYIAIRYSSRRSHQNKHGGKNLLFWCNCLGLIFLTSLNDAGFQCEPICNKENCGQGVIPFIDFSPQNQFDIRRVCWTLPFSQPTPLSWNMFCR